MKRAALLILAVCLAASLGITACDDPPTMTGPTPTPAPTEPSEPAPPPPEPVIPGPDWSFGNTRGWLSFPAPQASSAQLRQTIWEFRQAWPGKTLAINACSEVARWEHTPYNDGPEPFSDENLENLRRFLNVTADEGVQVRLNIFCTVRDTHRWMDENWERYTRTVARMVAKHNHVFLSVANEPYHRDSWFKNNDDRIRAVRDAARGAGFTGFMGADDNLGCPDPNICSFVYAYRRLGFTPDFHPYRDPEPGPGSLRALVAANGLPLLISEPVCYSTTRDDRLCTGDQTRIISYFRKAEREGIEMYYHSLYYGLDYPNGNPQEKWIPIP